jgi:hypothetical protein
MIEQSGLRVSQQKFKETVGFRATTRISEKGAWESAGIIVELDELIISKNTQPIDLFKAVIATSQLLSRWDQLQKSYISGEIPYVINNEELFKIGERIKFGNLSKDEIKKLTQESYVASPERGVYKALEVLNILHDLYPEYRLCEDTKK